MSLIAVTEAPVQYLGALSLPQHLEAGFVLVLTVQWVLLAYLVKRLCQQRSAGQGRSTVDRGLQGPVTYSRWTAHPRYVVLADGLWP